MKVSYNQLNELRTRFHPNLDIDSKGRLIYPPYKECFCGSGKHYKFCHKNKSSDRNTLLAAFNRITDSKECLVPEKYKIDCDSRPIKSHSVSKGGMLKKIAEGGNVYTLLDNDIFSYHRANGVIKAKKKGIKQASIFYGFCRKHDSELFSPFENNTYEYTSEQNFLLLYRSICLELYKKKDVVYRQSKILEEFNFHDDLLDNLDAFKTMQGSTKYAKISLADISEIKKELDKQLVDKDYSKIKTYFIKIKEIPQIMFSGAVYPEYDFQGNKLIDLGQKEPIQNILNFNSILDKDGHGIFLFNWLDNEDKQPAKFIDSLNMLEMNETPAGIIRLLFEYCENTYFKISWWDNLSEKLQEELINSMEQGISSLIHQGSLTRRDINPVDWTIIDKNFID